MNKEEMLQNELQKAWGTYRDTVDAMEKARDVWFKLQMESNAQAEQRKIEKAFRDAGCCPRCHRFLHADETWDKHDTDFHS